MIFPIALVAITAQLAVQVVVVLIVLGIVWYFLSPYIADPFKSFIVVIVVLMFCLWLLRAFGII